MAYHLEGRLLEVCDCKVLCPCWIGEDPDNGTCKGFMAWHIDTGNVDGLDVTGRTVACLGDIPGNVLAGNWKAALYVDDGASPAQQDALISVFSGKRGGPIADLAKTIKKLPKVIDKATMGAVIRRIESVSQSISSLPIPKGIDPTKVRAQRPR